MITKIDEFPKKTRDDTLSDHEQIIKTHLEQWIADVNKKVELEQRLQKTFENSKSHTEFFSEL